MFLVAAVLLALIYFGARIIKKWEGVWKILATIPLLGMVVVLVSIVIDLSIGGGSRNLWPIEILIWGAIGLIFLLIIAGLRYSLQKSNGNQVNRDS